jgi:hypothetical protein
MDKSREDPSISDVAPSLTFGYNVFVMVDTLIVIGFSLFVIIKLKGKLVNRNYLVIGLFCLQAILNCTH